MYGYVLGSDSLSNLPAASDSDAKNRQGIVMLEVNLQNFSNEISPIQLFPSLIPFSLPGRDMAVR